MLSHSNQLVLILLKSSTVKLCGQWENKISQFFQAWNVGIYVMNSVQVRQSRAILLEESFPSEKTKRDKNIIWKIIPKNIFKFYVGKYNQYARNIDQIFQKNKILWTLIKKYIYFFFTKRIHCILFITIWTIYCEPWSNYVIDIQLEYCCLCYINYPICL